MPALLLGAPRRPHPPQRSSRRPHAAPPPPGVCNPAVCIGFASGSALGFARPPDGRARRIAQRGTVARALI
jgi:hypothetical protein